MEWTISKNKKDALQPLICMKYGSRHQTDLDVSVAKKQVVYKHKQQPSHSLTVTQFRLIQFDKKSAETFNLPDYRR